MRLVSAHLGLGILVGFVVFGILAVLDLPVLVALILGGLVGWLLVATVLSDVADRAEHWLSTMK